MSRPTIGTYKPRPTPEGYTTRIRQTKNTKKPYKRGYTLKTRTIGPYTGMYSWTTTRLRPTIRRTRLWTERVDGKQFQTSDRRYIPGKLHEQPKHIRDNAISYGKRRTKPGKPQSEWNWVRKV